MTQVAPREVGPRPLVARAGYRADVEGLRAVAVLLVMATHAGLTQVRGGYVGVDVFFVISGFLITQLLVRELRATGRLRLRRFYARRARRLLPASVVVLVVTAALVWALLPRNRWVSTAFDVMASAVYGINWRLAAQSVDYLREFSAPSAVQHFWSLAVEEQFYLIWPALLLGAAFVARRRAASMDRTLLLAVAVVGLPSLAWSVYYTGANPARAYFVSTTRLWELALGAAVAIVALNGRTLPRASAVVVGWLGLAAIGASAVLFSSASVFPGYLALVPTLGAAAVIAAGMSRDARTRWSVAGLLSTGPMESVGRLSYSLYLCHWPMVVIAAGMSDEQLSPAVGVLVVAASVIPAYLLHHHVENPIRYSRTRFVRSMTALQAAAIGTIVSLIAGMGLWLASWPPPPPFVPPSITQLSAKATGPGERGTATAPVDPAKADPNGILGAALLDAEDPLGDQNGAPRDSYPAIVPRPEVALDDYIECSQNNQSAEIRSCVHGRRGSAKVVAVVGDSHANQWVPGLAEIAERRGWELREYTKVSCAFSDVTVATKVGQPYTSCPQWSAAVLDRLLTTEKPSMVIITQTAKGVWLDGEARFGDPRGQQLLTDGMRRYYRALSDAGIPVVVLQDSPKPGTDVPECIQSNPGALSKCATERSAALPDDHGLEQVTAAEGVPNVRVENVNDAICPTDRCAAVIGNVLVYRDASHLTGTYVRTLEPRLDERIGLAQQ